jgi:hypothetical protein
MLLPDVHDELVRAAVATSARRRLGTRTLSALVAAFATLLLAAPAAHAVHPLAGVTPISVVRGAE